VPSESRPGSSVDREEYPRLRSDIGEDPARFLDHELVTDEDMRRLVFARIRGIDTIATCRAWVAVERNLDRGPREKVIETLERRLDTLEQIGERPDRLTERDGRDIPEKRVFIGSEPADEQTASAVDKLAQIRSEGGAE